MVSIQIPHSFLHDRFNAFYREVLALKRQILLEDMPIFSADPLAAKEHPIRNLLADRLTALLDRYTAEEQEMEQTLSARLYREARFIMVALADEVFLTLDWPGRDYWRGHLLEEQYFQSQGAGELIFRKLDDLLLRNDPVYIDLAKVYLLALSLGFLGRYRANQNQAALTRYMEQLHYFVFKSPPSFKDSRMRLFPGAYEAIVQGGDPDRFPTMRRWKQGAVLALVVLLALMGVWWWDLTRDLNQVVEAILNNTRGSGM